MDELESRVLQHRFSNDEIRRSQQRVYETCRACRPNLADPNFHRFSEPDLRFLFQAIDDGVFQSLITQNLKASAHPLSFRISRRMTNSGGTTTMRTENGSKKRSFEIAISATLLFSSFADDPSKAIIVTGIPCTNRLQALQRIMEHEIVHLIEMLLWNDSSCHKPRFKNIVKRFFGHRESHHQLLRPQDVARIHQNIRPGDWVTFSFENRKLIGRVNRITKRATVLVPDPHGTRYSDGRHYRKFYVPVKALRRSRPQ